jgi:hypothetical protein
MVAVHVTLQRGGLPAGATSSPTPRWGVSTRRNIWCFIHCGLGTRNSSPRGLIIRLIIQTIRRDPSGSVWIDEAPNVSRPDRSGADQIDAEHQATDLAVRRACWPVPQPCSPVPVGHGCGGGRCCCRLSSVAAAAVSACPCRGRGCPQCRGRAGSWCPAGRVRCSRVRTAGTSRPRRPGPLDQRKRATPPCAALPWCRNGGCGPAAVLPQPAGQPDTAAGV